MYEEINKYLYLSNLMSRISSYKHPNMINHPTYFFGEKLAEFYQDWLQILIVQICLKNLQISFIRLVNCNSLVYFSKKCCLWICKKKIHWLKTELKKKIIIIFSTKICKNKKNNNNLALCPKFSKKIQPADINLHLNRVCKMLLDE